MSLHLVSKMQVISQQSPRLERAKKNKWIASTEYARWVNGCSKDGMHGGEQVNKYASMQVLMQESEQNPSLPKRSIMNEKRWIGQPSPLPRGLPFWFSFSVSVADADGFGDGSRESGLIEELRLMAIRFGAAVVPETGPPCEALSDTVTEPMELLRFLRRDPTLPVELLVELLRFGPDVSFTNSSSSSSSRRRFSDNFCGGDCTTCGVGVDGVSSTGSAGASTFELSSSCGCCFCWVSGSAFVSMVASSSSSSG